MSSFWKQLKPSLFVGTLTVALYFSGILAFWTSLPLFYLSLNTNRITWNLSLLWVALLSVAFYTLLFPALFHETLSPSRLIFGMGVLGYYLLIGTVMSLAVWRRWSLVRCVGGGALGLSALILLIGFLLQSFGWVDVLGFLSRSIAQAAQTMEEIAQSSSASGKRMETLLVVAQMKNFLNILPQLAPAIIFDFTVVIMALNLTGLSFVHRSSIKHPWSGKFNRLQIPHFCLWLLIGAGFLYFFEIDFFRQGWPKIVSLNFFIILGFLYFLQGMSVLAHFMRRYSPLFRMGIYGLTFLFFQMTSLVFLGLGVADIWFDFRRLSREKSKGVKKEA